MRARGATRIYALSSESLGGFLHIGAKNALGSDSMYAFLIAKS